MVEKKKENKTIKIEDLSEKVEKKEEKIINSKRVPLVQGYVVTSMGEDYFNESLAEEEFNDILPLSEQEYFNSFELLEISSKFGEYKIVSEGKMPRHMNSADVAWFRSKSSYLSYMHGFNKAKRAYLAIKKEHFKKILKEKEKENLKIKNIEELCKAVNTLMYNASCSNKQESEICVINLIGWVQWAKLGIFDEKTVNGVKISPRFLSFYSSRGGTGKSYVISALEEFYKENGLIVSRQDGVSLSGRFTSDDVVDADLLVADDLFFNLQATDVNYSKLNLILDRSVINQEKKGVDSLQKKTNCSLISSTNYLYSNRRISTITIRETQVVELSVVPTLEELKKAWETIFYYCPALKSYSVMEKNETGEENLRNYYESILNYFAETEKTTVRGFTLIKNCCGRKEASKRVKRIILETLKKLTKEGCLTNLTNRTLEIDKYEFNEENYYAFIQKQSEEKEKEKGKEVDLSQEVLDKYYNDDLIKKERLRAMDKRRIAEKFIRDLGSFIPEKLVGEEKEYYEKSIARIEESKKFEEMMSLINKKEETNADNDSN